MTAGEAGSGFAAIGSAALLAAALRLVSRGLVRTSISRERLVESFAGGVSLAFVLLDLFVELVEGATHDLHEVVRGGPEPVHTMALLILIGAALTFGAHVYNARHAESWRSYAVALVPQSLYALLVGAALDGELHEGTPAFALFWLAMALHLGVVEHRLGAHFPREHGGASRAVSAIAPVVGAGLWEIAAPPAGLFHVLLAIVAGATLLGIFREEIPDARDVRAGAFFGGIVAFGSLVQIRWWL